MRSELLEAVGQDGVGLRVEFERRGDRYAHVISRVGPGGKVRPLLESVEGLPTDDWPASPPLQSLHMQELPDGKRAALLVGMAGRSHWSASIEIAPGKAEIVFDIACRCGAGRRQLGSEYRWLIEVADPRFEFAAADERTEVRRTEERVVIGPAKTVETAATTVRWRYRVTVPSTEY
jgi:hypothetical protein